jgi:surface antigen
METDAVRGMAGRARQTADDLDGRIDALLSQIENMEWQSNARTEFDDKLTSTMRILRYIANVIRVMGVAAGEEVSQWDVVASKLGGSFVPAQGSWQSAMDQLASVESVFGAILIGIGISGTGRNPTNPIDSIPRRPGSYQVGRNIQGPSWQPDSPESLPKPGDSTGGAGSAGAPTEGIPSSRTPADKLAILGGCTNYVATKRDVSGFWKPGKMNATYWNENAQAAGFEVGSKPVPGSIMVVEADNGVYNGIMDVNDKAGHVLYVESVKETDGGYLVSYSHAGTLYNDAGNYIPGTYKMLNNSKPVFVPYESPAVSFIYDKA